jgi:5'(3')-deoxyribonucleotidase
MKQILYIDLDGVIADYDAHKHLTLEHDPEGAECKVPENFFTNLPLIEGAIEAVNKLSEFYEIYFLSTPQWSNPNCWKEKRLWIEKHFGELGFKKLILTHNKGLNKGDYLIDDSIRNGVEGFEGEHIYFGTEKFPNWTSVVKYLTHPVQLKRKFFSIF